MSAASLAYDAVYSILRIYAIDVNQSMRPRAVLGRQSGRHIRSAPWQSGPISRPAIAFISGRGRVGQVERSADSRSPFSCRLHVAFRDLRGSDRDAPVLSAANPSTKEAKQMGPCFVRGREPAGDANRDAEGLHERGQTVLELLFAH